MIIPSSVADPLHFDADPDTASHFDADPDPSFGCRSGSSLSRSCGWESGSYLSIWCGSMRIRIHNTDTHFKLFEITAWGRLTSEILVADALCTVIMVSCHLWYHTWQLAWVANLAGSSRQHSSWWPTWGGGRRSIVEEIPRIN